MSLFVKDAPPGVTESTSAENISRTIKDDIDIQTSEISFYHANPYPGMLDIMIPSYNISKGWNLIGTTVPDAISISDVLVANNAYDKFQVIKNVTGHFWTAEFAQISTFTPGEGYMVYALEEIPEFRFPLSLDYLNLDSYISALQNVTFSLNQGWNMISYYATTPGKITDILVANNAYDKVQVAKNVTGHFWTHEFSQLSHFQPGEGYMVYAIEAFDFNIQIAIPDNDSLLDKGA